MAHAWRRLRPWQIPHPRIIVLAVLIHVAWGILLIINPTVASSAAILGGFHWIISYGVGGPWLGALLIVGALLAYMGLELDHRISNGVALALLMPQFALLIGAFLSDAESVFTGVLPDGRVVDQFLLFVVLCPIMFTSVLHTFAIIERHSTWTRT